MHVYSQRPLTRRSLFTAAGAVAVAAVSGCSVFGGAPETITVTAAPTAAPENTAAPLPETSAELLGLVFSTRLQVQNLTTAIAQDKRDAPLFSMLLTDRQAHLKALEAEYARQFGAPPESSGPVQSTTTKPGDPDEVIGRIRSDATDGQGKFTDAVAGASRFQAQLFGSIAACLATHRMVLS